MSVVSSQNFLESAGVQAQSVSIDATNDVTWNGNVTTTGTATANADSDADGHGAFIIASGVTVTTNNHALSITAATMNLSGVVTLDSGTAATTIQASAGETLPGRNDPSEQITIDATALSNIHSGALVLARGRRPAASSWGRSTSAQSSQVGPVTLIADSTLSSAADITFKAAADVRLGRRQGIKAITATAAHNINVNAAVSTSPAGDVYLEAGNNLTIQVGGGSITTAGVSGGTLTVNGGISIHDINVGAGNVTLIAHGAGADLTVGDVSIGASITLQAPRDVIVIGQIKTTAPLANVTLTADVALTGIGGVWITATGSILATGNVNITGSQIFNTHPQPFTDPATTTGASIQIDANSVSQDPISAGGNIMRSRAARSPRPVPTSSSTGLVGSSAAGTVDITAQHDIQLATTISSLGGAISMHSPVILNTATAVSSGGAT